MKITIRPTSLLLVSKDKTPIAVIANPTLELITTALKEHDDLEDATLTNPRDFNGSDEPEETLTFHCCQDGEDHYQDIVISEICTYGERKILATIDDVIEALGDKEFDTPFTDEHLAYLRDNFTVSGTSTQYLLLGEDACRTLDNYGEKNFLEVVSKGTHGLTYAITKTTDNPIKLLNDFKGWGDYQLISKSLYNKLKEI